jgi:nucleoside-diphosphate-sugar epimerase
MKVLITGGNGFVGVNLAELLVGRGVDVVTLSRGPLPPGALEVLSGGPGHVTVATGDVRDEEALTELMAGHGVTHVFHAAIVTAGADRERSDARTIVDVNVMGTRATLEAARKTGVGRFVYASSGAVYGDIRYAPEPVGEEACPDPATMYGITKLAGEMLVRRYGELWGLETVSARINAVFGPWERDTGSRDTLSPIMAAGAIAVRAGHARVGPGSPQDWIYSRDVAIAAAALLEHPALAHQAYNIAPGTAWDIDPWLDLLVERFPGFSYEMVEDDADVPQFTDPARTRTPVRADLIRHVVPGFPTFDRDAALVDYVDWLEAIGSHEGAGE